MKSILALLCLAVVASAMTDRESWAFFKNKFGKSYSKLGEEKSRYGLFVQNLRRAEVLQAGSKSAIFGITQFMDLSLEEFHKHYANLNATNQRNWIRSLGKTHQHHSKVQDNNPVDWRGKAVASVKNQQQCGDCWAFSASGALEGCAMIANGGQEVDVSAQQLCDCFTGSNGCNGGYQVDALNYATTNDMATWDSYPYNAVQGQCQTPQTVAVPANTCKFVAVDGTEDAMLSALQDSPVAIALDATPIMYYQGGIISGDYCGYTNIDHAVLLVAWDGQTYTVKNSWDVTWGESGFFRVQSGVNCLNMATENAIALPNNN